MPLDYLVSQLLEAFVHVADINILSPGFLAFSRGLFRSHDAEFVWLVVGEEKLIAKVGVVRKKLRNLGATHNPQGVNESLASFLATSVWRLVFSTIR